MSGALPPPPPDLTPPAQVRRLERSVEDLYAAQRDTGALIGANHMALVHSLGQLAGRLEQVAACVEDLNRTVHAIAIKLGVAS